jgi:hypothetical protein
MALGFFLGGLFSVFPGAVLDYFPGVEGWVRSHVWCMMLTCDFCSFIQAGLETAVGEKWHCWAWHRETFHRLGVQDIAGFDSD